MSIITFGGANVHQNKKQATLTEELMDEHLSSRLTQAFTSQREGNYNAAMEVYLEVLKSSTLVDSVIEKHLIMKDQCHRSLGDVFEHLQAFEHAKHHYTQALKLNAENFYAWTRLGFINYDHLDDLQLAKRCFLAATKTMPTLERIGTRICVILVKLAEISFMEAEYRESERTVDAILSRQPQDRKTLIFAYLMKCYFSAFQSNHEQAQVFLHKAQQIQSDCKVSDLELFHRVKARQLKEVIVFNETTQSYQALDGTDNRCSVQLTLTDSDGIDTFPAFLTNFIESILSQTNLEAFKKNEFVYDCGNFIEVIKQKKQLFMQNWNTATQDRVQNPHEDQPMHESKPVVPVTVPTAAEPTKKEKQKNLRKKPDNIEQQIRQLNFSRFQPYREFVYIGLGQDSNEFMSGSEILQFAKLMQRGPANTQNEQANFASFSGGATKLSVEVLSQFQTILESKLHMQGCGYFVRNLLRYLCHQEGLLTYVSAPLAFRLFLMKADNATWQITEPKVLQTMFELTLFNQYVIKETKSGPIMSLRFQLYDFCNTNYSDLLSKVDCPILRFRLNYAMMFTAFEIKNDMEQSVMFYEKLDFAVLQSHGSIPLPWVSDSFQIDEQQVSHFGNQKIKEAQMINQQNQALREMKQSEFESTKTAYVRQTCEKSTALFYLEQFFLHLVNLLQSHDTSQTAQVGVNFQLNDDKLKEMWDQLMFCLVRVQPSTDFFTMACHIFCVLAAFKSLTTRQQLQQNGGQCGGIYETVLLKKIDFEPLLQEIAERSREVLQESGVYQQPYASYQKLTADVLVSRQIEPITLYKLLTHLVRMVTPDFLYYNVRVGGSMANVQDPGQPFLTQFLKCLFYLEHLKSNLAKDHMQGVALLLRQLDEVAQEHPELLMRSYSRLFVVSFPSCLKTLNNGAKDNSFQILLEKSFKYLFNFIAPDSTQPQVVAGAEDVQIDMDEITELSLFQGLKVQQAEKPKYPLQTPYQMFSQMVLNNKKELDVAIIHDVVKFADTVLQGRLLKPNQLTQKDVQNCVRITETIAKLLQQKDLAKGREEEHVNYSQFLRQKCFKENPFSFQQKPANYGKHQYPGLHQVIIFLMNVYGSLAIQVYPYNVVTPFNRRYQLMEKLNSLRDLRKLRSLIRLDLQYTDDFAETALLSSVIDLQYYMQAASSKLLTDYKNAESYIDQRQCKDQATNAAIWALSESFQNGNLEQCLEAMHQLLSIYYVRVMTKRDTSHSNIKFKNLIATCYYLAQCCELLQCRLATPRKDPRITQVINREEQLSLAKSIIQTLLQSLATSYANGTSKQCLVSQVDAHITMINLNSDNVDSAHLRSVPKTQLNPDYPFMQVHLSMLGPSDLSYRELQLSRKAFDIATSQNNIGMAMETLLHLIERQLLLAIRFKYQKIEMMDKKVQEVVDQFTRPFLSDADSYLQKFSDQQNPREDQEPFEVLFDQKASHLVRGKLHLPVTDMIIDGIILRLYKTADTLVTILGQASANLAYTWISIRLKQMLYQSLIQEIMSTNPDNLKILAEQGADQLLKELQDAEDSLQSKMESLGQQPIFCTQQLSMSQNSVQDRPLKSLIAMYFSCTIHKSLTELRIRTKLSLVSLWEDCHEYDMILALYRRQLDLYKRSVNQQGVDKLQENLQVFIRSKESLINTIHLFTSQLLDNFMKIRQQFYDFEQNKTKKGQGYTECRQLYKDLKSKYELTATNSIPLIKDIFELFLETHYSKQFLKKHSLVTDVQKRTIKQALLKACALCGPDDETDPGAGKFLDLAKLTDDEYQTEALGVCIKWYCVYLESHHKKAKKDAELARKLQACYDEIKIEVSAAAVSGQVDVVMQSTPQKQTPVLKQEISAQKVFTSQKKQTVLQ